jgi:hypothetical protein
MGATLKVTCADHTSAELRALAGKCTDGAQVRRMLALALVLEGRSRSEAAALNGMDRQTLRDWVHRYNAAGIAGLKSRQSPGRVPYLTEQQLAELRDLVIRGPIASSGGGASTCRPRWRGDFPSRCMKARSANGCISLA